MWPPGHNLPCKSLLPGSNLESILESNLNPVNSTWSNLVWTFWPTMSLGITVFSARSTFMGSFIRWDARGSCFIGINSCCRYFACRASENLVSSEVFLLIVHILLSVWSPITEDLGSAEVPASIVFVFWESSSSAWYSFRRMCQAKLHTAETVLNWCTTFLGIK